MPLTILYMLLGLGLLLLVVGLLLLGGVSYAAVMVVLTAVLSLINLGDWLRGRLRNWMQETRLRRVMQPASTQELTRQLLGSYTPYVIEAAEQLGATRDTAAVPHLMYALETCVNWQQPGWRDRAEAFVNALSRIGDRRALPLLSRLENVRGIGLLPAIRHAIAEIEPQTSLLRPGEAPEYACDTLLTPARSETGDPETLLRTGIQ